MESQRYNPCSRPLGSLAIFIFYFFSDWLLPFVFAYSAFVAMSD